MIKTSTVEEELDICSSRRRNGGVHERAPSELLIAESSNSPRLATLHYSHFIQRLLLPPPITNTHTYSLTHTHTHTHRLSHSQLPTQCISLPAPHDYLQDLGLTLAWWGNCTPKGCWESEFFVSLSALTKCTIPSLKQVTNSCMPHSHRECRQIQYKLLTHTHMHTRPPQLSPQRSLSLKPALRLTAGPLSQQAAARQQRDCVRSPIRPCVRSWCVCMLWFGA